MPSEPLPRVESLPTKRVTGARVENRWKRKDGSPSARAGAGLQWLARYVGSDGREHSKAFKTQKLANAWLREQSAAVTRGDWVDPTKSAATVGEVAKSWTAGNASKTAATAEGYGSVWRTHVEPRWGSVPLRDVDHDEIVAWIGGLTDGTAETTDGLSASSVRHCHAVLHQILQLAVRSKRLRSNPAKDVPLPKMRASDKVYLSVAEIERLAHAADYRASTTAERVKAGRATEHNGIVPPAELSESGLALRILGGCGVRFGELAGLRVSRVDFAKRTLRIDTAVSEVAGRLVVGDPKNHKERTVPIPARLIAHLGQVCDGRGGNEYVFTTSAGGALRRNNFAKRVLGPAAELAGIDDAVTLHSLRHSFASICLSNGVPPKQVQEWMGHHSLKLTADLYGHLFADETDRAQLLLDAAFEPAE
ncbi:tyrosine-type recombinase/integrase [Rhodococcus sp. 14-1411-2a]|uniref:tyrosine-type recombinase/integrase n=1 Tax=Rhodococcus sp. 14-1411-2a TaxID=2023151 RepID=UPI000B9C3F6A|nr:site-specific integrase [Rhodococcus sp. 14-1411-2a]OZF44619.1 hypothetical protein CH291_19915 [Rhodococcus sp. 14-1411-2a]